MNSESNKGMNDFFLLESNADSYRINIPQTRHINFTDFSLAGRYMRWLGAIGPADGVEVHNQIRSAVAGFFKTFLSCETTDWEEYLRTDSGQDLLAAVRRNAPSTC